MRPYVILKFCFIKSSEDFTIGPKLLIYYNQTLSNSGLSSKRAHLEYWFLKYLFLAPKFFIVNPEDFASEVDAEHTEFALKMSVLMPEQFSISLIHLPSVAEEIGLCSFTKLRKS